MYNIMVVEDSALIMHDIINQIESVDNCLKVVETAKNGVDALEKLKKCKVDIIFTDVVMPEMDGLTLIQEIRKLYPSIKCIIVSGYNYFEYTREAINLQVIAYLLKPVEWLELKEVISHLIDCIRSERSLRAEAALHTLLSKKDLKTDLDVIFDVSPCFIIIRQGISRRIGDVIDDLVLRNCLMISGFIDDFYIVETGFPCEKVVFFKFSQTGYTEFNKKLSLLLNSLCSKYRQINIIISPDIHNASCFYEVYNDLSNALSYLISIGNCQIFKNQFIYDFADFTTLNAEVVSLNNKIAYLVKNQLISSLKDELERFLNNWSENNWPAIFIKRLLTVIIEELNSAYGKNTLKFLDDTNTDVDQLLSDCHNYTDIYRNICIYIDNLESSFNERNSSTKNLIDGIEYYMKSNIYDNLTMQDLSEQFNVSTSYINRLVKKKHDMPPIEYYIQLKIEEAKKLISTNEAILIKDISDSLGFSNQHYFSKVFKAHTGVSPLMFKKLIHDGDA
ncbi:response regulator transcription factor [Paenibacillus ferrarius]|uniref:response regulator transcription factor n=1 Tax=Paenibacillus ferrarius TaxID=1469647 RepID=UPI003D2D0B8F